MGKEIVIKIIGICIIIFIALIDIGLNLVSLIPVVGDIAATGGEILLEAIQLISAAVVAFVGGKEGEKKSRMYIVYGLCAFAFLGLLDVGINFISFIPVVGDIAETLGETVLEILQVAIVAVLAFL